MPDREAPSTGDPGDDVPKPSFSPPQWGGAPPVTAVNPWYATCAHHYQDAVSQALCGGVAPPNLTSLASLRQLLGTTTTGMGVSLVGESTGLAVRVVTPLNPLVVSSFGAVGGGPFGSFGAMTYARGQPFVELAAGDPSSGTFGDMHFFLIRFHIACEADGTCTPADYLLPSVESNWTSYELYDDSQLVNTPRDCMTCHQAGGPQSQKMFRFQEKDAPWEHWFNADFPERQAAFTAMHGGEQYGALPAGTIGDPQNLVTMMMDEDDYDEQENTFPTTTIEAELAAHGTSATWDAIYATSVQGHAIAPPFYAPSQLDADRAAEFADTYAQVAAGTLPKSALPSVDTLLSDAAQSGMSIHPRAGLDGQSMLTQMCAECHNRNLDQTQTRALFDATIPIAQIPGEEREAAVARMNLSDDDPLKMPPPVRHAMTDAERDTLRAALWQ